MASGGVASGSFKDFVGNQFWDFRVWGEGQPKNENPQVNFQKPPSPKTVIVPVLMCTVEGPYLGRFVSDSFVGRAATLFSNFLPFAWVNGFWGVPWYILRVPRWYMLRFKGTYMVTPACV